MRSSSRGCARPRGGRVGSCARRPRSSSPATACASRREDAEPAPKPRSRHARARRSPPSPPDWLTPRGARSARVLPTRSKYRESASPKRKIRFDQTISTATPKHGLSTVRGRRRRCPPPPRRGRAPGNLRVGLDGDHQLAVTSLHFEHMHAVTVEHGIGPGTPARTRTTPIVVQVGAFISSVSLAATDP
jgi:hypothetical protein